MTMQRYVSDMLAVIKHVEEAVDRQKTDNKVVRMPTAHDLLQRISQVLDAQDAQIRAHQAQWTGDAGAQSTIKETVANTLGQAAGMIGMLRNDKVSLMLRDDYTALNLAAMAYTMLSTTALALKDEPTAAIAASNLRELTPLIIEINEVMPQILVQELVDEANQIDMSVVDEAIRITQDAWEAKHVHLGHHHTWETGSPTSYSTSGAGVTDTGETFGGSSADVGHEVYRDATGGISHDLTADPDDPTTGSFGG
jgi:hypothetical protein